ECALELSPDVSDVMHANQKPHKLLVKTLPDIFSIRAPIHLTKLFVALTMQSNSALASSDL
ncbi:hypothetical protein, partial [Yersinia pestis]|uniref:hypothetical protein n=1 Tax=Yersinia pestis TaxID=632 RepID=UPI0005764D84